MQQVDRRLILVSNDFPARLVKVNDEWQVKRAPGGLVTALEPLAEGNGSLWFGWPGCSDLAPAERLLREHSQQHDYELRGVMLSERDIKGFNDGFCNRTLWPIFASLPEYAKYESGWWHSFVDVNRKFAEKIAAEAEPEDILWIHDFQVILIAKHLRELGFDDTPLAFFLHTPFPPANIFRRLPWREQVLRALLDFDLLGFHVPGDVNNFKWCMEEFLPEVEYYEEGELTVVDSGVRKSYLQDYPISMDFDQFEGSATSERGEQFTAKLNRKYEDSTLILGTERLDYTKGVPEKLQAYEVLLDQHPELMGEVRLLQMLVPSRMRVPDFQLYRSRVEELVGRINGKFGTENWTPVSYFFHKVEPWELGGYYRAADICYVNSVVDGMNLVAKEYCACQVDKSGVLVLSEFTGAVNQLGEDALVVNPYNVEHAADTLKRAIDMDKSEREQRMTRLREQIREQDVHWWRNRFVDDLRSLQ